MSNNTILVRKSSKIKRWDGTFKLSQSQKICILISLKRLTIYSISNRHKTIIYLHFQTFSRLKLAALITLFIRSPLLSRPFWRLKRNLAKATRFRPLFILKDTFYRSKSYFMRWLTCIFLTCYSHKQLKLFFSSKRQFEEGTLEN